MGVGESQPNPNIDIFDDEDRNEMNERNSSITRNNPKFANFVKKYSDDFIKREEKNKNYFLSLLDNWNDQHIRPNVSVLVIIPSNYEIYNVPRNKSDSNQENKYGDNQGEKNEDGQNYQDESIEEDKIENDQDESTEEDKSESEQEDKIVNNKKLPRFFRDSVDMTNGLLILHLFRNAFGIPLQQMLITTITESDPYNDDEFCFFQDINLAQVGKIQYKFLLDESLESRIKLFKDDSINQLISNDQSYLFVFFIGSHTSLIEITKACIEFGKIFSNHINLQYAPALFHFLTVVGVVNQDFFFEIINSKLENENADNDIIQYKTEIQTAINLAFYDDQYQQRLINLINKLGSHLAGIKCDPKIFIQFSLKATIFASSILGDVALTLPFRKINIFYHTQYRVCGSIFTSVYIESLLAASASLTDFKASVIRIFQKYKEDFQSHIINQNKQKDKKNKNRDITSESQIIKFFEIIPDDINHFFTLDINCWPDLKSILTPQTKWNVDISTVNPNEYDDISLGELLIKRLTPSALNNSNKYGPSGSENRLSKFLMDFESAVNLKLEENNIPKKFKIDKEEEDEQTTFNFGLGFWGDFYYRINKYIIPNLSRGIVKLEKPISKYFNEKSDYCSSSVVNLFCEAYIIIFQFWKNYYL